MIHLRTMPKLSSSINERSLALEAVFKSWLLVVNGWFLLLIWYVLKYL